MKSTSAAIPHILVFDSGVGGLSIVDSILDRMPTTHLTFCSDAAAYPYGTKEESYVIDRVVSVVTKLVSKLAPDLVVIACNTASTVALPSLRQQLNIPVVGVVPAIKTAAEVTKTRQIGLLATPATVARHYTDQLILDFANDCVVVKCGSAKLVDMAENWVIGQEPELELLQTELRPFFASEHQDIDTMVLGCTHFPLLRTFLQSAAPSIKYWIDSGEAIAKRSEHMLNHLGFAVVDPSRDVKRQVVITGNSGSHKLIAVMRTRQFQILDIDLEL